MRERYGAHDTTQDIRKKIAFINAYLYACALDSCHSQREVHVVNDSISIWGKFNTIIGICHRECSRRESRHPFIAAAANIDRRLRMNPAASASLDGHHRPSSRLLAVLVKWRDGAL